MMKKTLEQRLRSVLERHDGVCLDEQYEGAPTVFGGSQSFGGSKEFNALVGDLVEFIHGEIDAAEIDAIQSV